MSDDRLKQVAELYMKARAVPSGERDAWLEHESGGDADLMMQVRLMLGSAEPAAGRAGKTMPTRGPGQPVSPGDGTGWSEVMRSPPPESFGVYRVLDQIGEGGFGIVYEVEQREPVRRRVAMKVMKRGMDSEQFVARFEAERQAAAMMTHPNIARIFDAGLTPDGRPYFTMELVRGAPITEYCDSRRLSIEERLALFRSVCQAIQHAHQRGLIHRDIKPSNILVSAQEHQHAAKVIDFGVAKAIGGGLTERTIYTARDQLVGTPEYMSPEQADQSVSLIDTRSDVYSLGAVLFELLVGGTPHDSRHLRSGGIERMRREIAETRADRPSQRISSQQQRLGEVAALRSIEPSALLSRLRGDLDWIVLRCLEREIDRRYPSARELDLDLERFLNHETVVARPPSPAYRLRKLVRRRRPLVIAAAAIVAVALLGVGAFVSQSFETARERNAALDAKAAAESARDRERQAREISEQARRTAESISLVLRRFFDGVSPAIARGRDAELLRSLIDDAAVDARRTLTDQPAAYAPIALTLGRALNRIGEIEPARDLLLDAENLSAEAFGERSDERVQAMLELSLNFYRSDEIEAAQRWSREALDIAIDENAGSSNTLVAVIRHAQTLQEFGEYEELDRLLVAHLPAMQERFDPLNPDLLALESMMATAHLELGRPNDAVALFDDVLRRLERALDDRHPQLIRAFGNAARAHAALGDDRRAETLAQRSLSQGVVVLGDMHPDVLIIRGTLANAFRDQGRTQEALRLYERLAEQRAEVYGPRSSQRMVTLNNMASMLLDEQEYERAEALFREVVDVWSERRGPSHPFTLIAESNLAETLMATGFAPEAERMLARVEEGLERSMPAGHWTVGAVKLKRAEAFRILRDLDEATRLLEEAYDILRLTPGEGEQRAIEAAHVLVQLAEEQRDPQRAALWQARIDSDPMSGTDPQLSVEEIPSDGTDDSLR